MLNWLIERAKRTPYFHLPGYMLRWWLVPYNEVVTRPLGFVYRGHGEFEPCVSSDGTGPVDWKRRPIARLIQKCGLAIRIHEILSSDPGEHPHDHPRWYLTIILRGTYTEIRYHERGFATSVKEHGPGSILFRRANSWHMLVLPERQTCTTLFITGKKVQSFGFNVDGKKVLFRDYRNKEKL